jgi:hypothetical protein
VQTSLLLPLELAVQKLTIESRDKFPDIHTDYWSRYTSLLDGLRTNVYHHINAGLSCLSKSPGIYTDHGSNHFDEVVRYAGLLLGIPEVTDIGLEPYELYLLLCAIRLHDAGNVNGRDDHEKRVSHMIHRYGGNIANDAPEAQLISQIAEAHGGKTLDGNKDTIGQLPADGCIVGAATCRPRQVAAIVRFADEICEHRTRAAQHHIASESLPDTNKLFHYYAASIAGAVPSRKNKNFKLRLDINTKYLTTKYPTPPNDIGLSKDKYLIDDVLDRICKLDLERRYCNQFLDPNLQIDQLEIDISLKKHQDITSSAQTIGAILEVAKHEIRIPIRSGYPESEDIWKTTVPQLKGKLMANRAKREWK